MSIVSYDDYNCSRFPDIKRSRSVKHFSRRRNSKNMRSERSKASRISRNNTLLSKKSGRSIKSKHSVKLEINKKLLETNKNANNELREEIRRLKHRLGR